MIQNHQFLYFEQIQEFLDCAQLKSIRKKYCVGGKTEMFSRIDATLFLLLTFKK